MLIFPRLVARKFYYNLNNPIIKKTKDEKSKVFANASKEIIKFNKLNIQTYYWPGEKKEILLVHGWEGRANNFEKIIERLIDEKFSVRAFDAPSHGSSEKSNKTMNDFGNFVQYLLKTSKYDFAITHSFGAVPCSFTLSENDIKLKKIIFIAPPDHFIDWINDVASLIGINKRVINIAIEKFVYEYGMNPYNMSVSKWMQNSSDIDGLIIHGKNDKITPLERAKNVHKKWKNSQLKVINDIGHFKILNSHKTINTILRYLKD